MEETIIYTRNDINATVYMENSLYIETKVPDQRLNFFVHYEYSRES